MKISELKLLLEGKPTPAELVQLRLDKRSGVQKLLQGYDRKSTARRQEQERLAGLLVYENKYYAQGAALLAGVDEAGRGPLAGPLVIGAVILPRKFDLPRLNDSKKLSAAVRERLYDAILVQALAVKVNVVCVADIDALNIYQATRQGMEMLLQQLKPRPQVALVDAMSPRVEGLKTVSLIHGDALSASIAAASIIAKVTRDRMMVELDQQYPEYGFAEHKGYGCARHMEAIRKYGATVEHRRSYEPVKSLELAPLAFGCSYIFDPRRPEEPRFNYVGRSGGQVLPEVEKLPVAASSSESLPEPVPEEFTLFQDET